MKKLARETITCEHCRAEADITLEGFEGVKEVLRRTKRALCKSCWHVVDLKVTPQETYSCEHCGAEADMTLEGFEKVEDVVKREKGLTCKACGRDIPWTGREEIKAIQLAIEAEKEAYQNYSRLAKKTKDPKGRDMFEQLSEFEVNHYRKLRDLLKTLREKGEWISYEGTSFKKRPIPPKPAKPKGEEQLTDMDALKIAIQEEKKAEGFYRSMAELAQDGRGREMYKRLADEEALHEKVLNDQYYSLHNTGLWSWGD